ncbi:MAG: hypothetical protein EB121_06670 [Alphaproteobacteria bacterium]|nr:hypothetical protein [Alphaproteobacteria bacterium]NDG05013.1 hypothetical protein [Alphaproteobacteria bacterium]
MKSLGTLIKLQKAKVDEQRLVLADKEEILQKLENQMAELSLRMMRERDFASSQNDHDIQAQFGLFIQRATHQLKQLDIARQAALNAVLRERDALAVLFEEQKRYEIVAASRAAKAEAEYQKRTQAELDEVAQIVHERKG